MKRVTSSENKKVVLGILSYIHKICVENNIEYSLGAGTLLGAIRHGGFIPWDDDGDVIVRRNDYNRLIKILEADQNSHYGFISEKVKGYYYVFSKVYDKNTILKTLAPQDSEITNLGVYVDIFPIDNVPLKQDEAEKFYEDAMNINYKMYMSIPGFYYFSDSPIKQYVKKFIYYPKYLRAVGKNRNAEYWKEKLLQKITSYQDENTGKAGFTLSEYKTREYMDSAIFNEYSDVTFEGRTYRKLSKYNDYLTALYGDYMELPPLEKRNPKHAYIEYWK